MKIHGLAILLLVLLASSTVSAFLERNATGVPATGETTQTTFGVNGQVESQYQADDGSRMVEQRAPVTVQSTLSLQAVEVNGVSQTISQTSTAFSGGASVVVTVGSSTMHMVQTKRDTAGQFFVDGTGVSYPAQAVTFELSWNVPAALAATSAAFTFRTTAISSELPPNNSSYVGVNVLSTSQGLAYGGDQGKQTVFSFLPRWGAAARTVTATVARVTSTDPPAYDVKFTLASVAAGQLNYTVASYVEDGAPDTSGNLVTVSSSGSSDDSSDSGVGAIIGAILGAGVVGVVAAVVLVVIFVLIVLVVLVIAVILVVVVIAVVVVAVVLVLKMGVLGGGGGGGGGKADVWWDDTDYEDDDDFDEDDDEDDGESDDDDDDDSSESDIESSDF